ncbi:MAG: hypothetical protein WAK55_08425 [Xanthobacteraceae bacterium]
MTGVTALAVPEAMLGQPERRLVMPTDLPAVSARKRNAQAQTKTDITMVLIWVIICLVVLVLLLADQSFAKATIEWECLF